MVEHTSNDSAHHLHFDSFVVDGHHDILEALLESMEQQRHGTLAQRWIPALRKGGVNVQFFPTFVDPKYLPELALRRTLLMIAAALQEFEHNTMDIKWIYTRADLEQCLAEGKIGAILAMEGSEPLGSDISLLPLFHRLGLRSLGLTWNHRTALADGVGVPHRAGLTPLGKDVVQRCNELGILVDVSHLNEQSFWDVLELSGQPIVATHSNARALCDHPRNLTDAQLKAVGQNGGVVGAVFCGPFVHPQEWTLDRVVDHILHMAEQCGIEHVGIGTDFLQEIGEEGVPLPASIRANTSTDIIGLSRIEHLPNLTRSLLERGLTHDEVRAVLGGNFLRVLRQVLPPP